MTSSLLGIALGIGQPGHTDRADASNSSGTSIGFGDMATWAEFEDAEDLAAFARERMRGRIVYEATLRLDGGPRVHPVSPWNRRRPAVRLVPRHEPEDARGRARRDEAVATEYSDEMPVYRRWRASPA